MAKNRVVFTVTLGELAEVPGTPFAYWAPKSLRELFQKYPPLDRDVARMPDKPKIADVKVGLQTSDDLRFTRFWWEVPVDKIGTSPDETFQGKKWVPFAKGGKPFFHDIQLVVNWEKGGEEIRNFPNAVIRNESFYFRAGLAWADIVSNHRFDMRYLQSGCIFAAGAHALFPKIGDIWSLLSFSNSQIAWVCFRLLEPTAHHKHIGYVAKISVAPFILQNQNLSHLSREAYDRLREWATGDETAAVFVAPWILQVFDALRSGTLKMPKTGHPLARDFEWRYGIPEVALEHARIALQNKFSLYALAEACVIWETELRKRIDEIQKQIDDEVYRLYEISDEDRAIIEAEMGKPVEAEFESEETEPEAEGEQEEETQPEGVLTCKEHFKRLIHYLAHQVIREDHDGIVPLQDCYPAGRNELELGLVSRVRRKLREIFGEEAMSTVERELQEALGKRLDDWLATDFFGYHVGLYRLRPIIWQITLPSSPESQRNQRSRRRSVTQTVQTDFSVFIYWHKLDSDTLRKVRHIYLQPFLDAAERELEQGIARVQSGNLTVSQLRDEAQRLSQAHSRLEALKNLAQRIDELLQPHSLQVESRSEWVKAKVNEIVANGYSPNLDYGVRVNIEPLKQKGILPRDAERVRG